MTLDEFLARYPPRPPARQPANDDELRKLTSADGIRWLMHPPVEAEEQAVPTRSGDPGCHLWVIDTTGVPYVLELAQVTPPLQSGRAKHSNLTGGGAAASGGELWVDPVSPSRLYVNGCSGRYGPRTEVQLDDSVTLLQSMGYEVESFGWEHDTDKPARVRR